MNFGLAFLPVSAGDFLSANTNNVNSNECAFIAPSTNIDVVYPILNVWQERIFSVLLQVNFEIGYVTSCPIYVRKFDP